MRPSFGSFLDEMEKIALIERLVRLGATPIKGTPKLLMKSRSPQELAALQNAVETGWNKRVTDPLMRVAEKGIKHLPGKAQKPARSLARLVAEDPIGTVVTNSIPLPGVHPAYLAGKKALERGIDKVAPLPK
jgi:hypothetical protein